MDRLVKNISLIFVGLLILEARKCSGLDNEDRAKWWETTLVYQLSTPFFQDTDGDGIGDLQGIVDRLDYISFLGVETICLEPIYPSPLINSGYDVTDHKDVHPMYGNLSDFNRLVEEAHARDMKIILDIVLDHTSNEHEWFNASINKEEPYADYYVWENGSMTADGAVAPPNNWTSIWYDSGNSAWTYNDERGEWYLHKFDESEPDLNLNNLDVLHELTLILTFWLDRGVDGFRIMGNPYVFEYPQFSQTEDLEFLSNIRSFVDEWTFANNSTDKFLITGNYDPEQNLSSYYDVGVSPLNHCFIKSTAIVGANANDLKTEITEWLDAIPSNATTNWMLSNNEHQRIASKAGLGRVDALHMLIMLLPGQAFTYYGDEIGMLSTPISSNNSMDSDSTTPEGKSYFDIEAEEKIDGAASHLNVYRQLAELRKNAVFVQGDWDLQAVNEDNILVLRRTLPDNPSYVVVINMAEIAQQINMAELYEDLSEHLQVVVVSGKNNTGRTFLTRSHFFLQSNAGVVLKSDETDQWQTIHLENESQEELEDIKDGSGEISESEGMDEVEKTTITVDEPTEKAVTEIHNIPDESVSSTSEDPSPENNAVVSVPDIVAGSCALLSNPFALICVFIGNMIIAGTWWEL